MGGRAFFHKTGHEAIRMDRSEYLRTMVLVRQLLSSSSLTFSDIPSYGQKESFGDIDVLVSKEGMIDRSHFDNLVFNASFVDKKFGIERNSNITSVLTIEGYQIDFILTKPKFYESSLAYYSFNDLGNFLGRIANSVGLKYGHDGLSIHAREGDTDYGDIHLSEDVDKIFEFFGWDSIYDQSFPTMESIFEFVSKQNHFIADRYKFENLDHTNRTRNRKRKSYVQFVEWLTENNKFGDEPTDEFRRAKRTLMQQTALDYFGKRGEWEDLWRNIEMNKVIKEKFNGTIVMNLTNLEGKDLGLFMADFKHRLGDNYKLKLFAMTPEEIEKEIISFAKATLI